MDQEVPGSSPGVGTIPKSFIHNSLELEPGDALAVGGLCFVRLVGTEVECRSGDEWLAIKGATSAGNIPLRIRGELGDIDGAATRARVLDVVALLESSTEEQAAELRDRDEL